MDLEEISDNEATINGVHMEDHNTDEKLWIMGNYVSGFSKSNTQMKYIQFMLWIFVEGKPPKKRLLYP